MLDDGMRVSEEERAPPPPPPHALTAWPKQFEFDGTCRGGSRWTTRSEARDDGMRVTEEERAPPPPPPHAHTAWPKKFELNGKFWVKGLGCRTGGKACDDGMRVRQEERVRLPWVDLVRDSGSRVQGLGFRV